MVDNQVDSVFISLVVHIIDIILPNNKDINTFTAKASEKPTSPLGLEAPRLAVGSSVNGDPASIGQCLGDRMADHPFLPGYFPNK